MNYVRPKSWKSTRHEAAVKRQEEHGQLTLEQWKALAESRRGNSAKELVKIAALIETHGLQMKVSDIGNKSKKEKKHE